MERGCGVLLHITSLPQVGETGTLGESALAFADFLQAAGQKYWQVLPVGPVDDAGSPYCSPSAFAGNPYLVDPKTLEKDGLLPGYAPRKSLRGVDFNRLKRSWIGLLRQAFAAFKPGEKFDGFCRDNADWLEDYALYMALKRHGGGTPWNAWEPEARRRDEGFLRRFAASHAGEIDFWRFVQYEFAVQWAGLKEYCGERGIKLIGDVPIYTAYDSADVWAHPGLFQLDEDLLPTEVAGVPPDAFSSEGQLWGNPLYDWDAMKQEAYSWWSRRMSLALRRFDLVRVDHFRGFADYYAIPYGDADATRGRWRAGPGAALFDALKLDGKVVAEDLGLLDDGVRELLAKTRFPGMKVLQFAFGSGEGNEYLPNYYPENCAAYTGTHDNDTTLGWWRKLEPVSRGFARSYLKLKRGEDPVWRMIERLLESRADLAVVPMQDYLNLGSAARMNTPATVTGNWRWRMEEQPSSELAQGMRRLAARCGR